MMTKFRAWDKEHREMVYPDDVDKIYFEITVDGIDTYNMRHVLPYDYKPPYLDTVVMQSTGLTDKNGKEIFEGDILEIKGHPFQRHIGEMSGMPVGIDIDGRYVIQYDREIAGYVVGNWKTREVIHYCTVIGNIHEHPELLERDGE